MWVLYYGAKYDLGNEVRVKVEAKTCSMFFTTPNL